MLLSLNDIVKLTKDDAVEYYNKNNKQIMKIFSQLITVNETQSNIDFAEFDEYDLASMQTIIYLLLANNENDSVIDISQKINQPDLDQDILIDELNNEDSFIHELFKLIKMRASLFELQQKGAIKVVIENGKEKFLINNKIIKNIIKKHDGKDKLE